MREKKKFAFEIHNSFVLLEKRYNYKDIMIYQKMGLKKIRSISVAVGRFLWQIVREKKMKAHG